MRQSRKKDETERRRQCHIQPLLSLLGMPQKTKLYHYHIYTEDLGQCHGCSMVISSFFVSPYKPMFVESMGILMEPLISQTPVIVSPHLQPDSPSSDNAGYASFSVFMLSG